VELSEFQNGSFHRPGPNSDKYEDARARCGAHLVFNAFWMIANFCVHQMLMRDGMHAIDLGIIITLIRAILHHFWGLWKSLSKYKEELQLN
jgi:hypothetical protein